MASMICEECGKKYRYEVDDFCPRCGAYNHPNKKSGVVVRVDGISETNHKGSFTHKEFHREKFQRRLLRMDRDTQPLARREITPPLGGADRTNSEKRKKNPVVTILIWLFILFELIIMMFE